MGGIKKKKKLFNKPKKLFDKERINFENKILKNYGLKNKKEIWKASSKISKIRRQAKNLIRGSDEEKAEFFEKLNKMGFKIKDISDVLALDEEDFLKRRLQTFIVKKNLASTPKQARQLIVHKNVFVDGKIVNIPSFIMTRDLEDKISLKEKKIKKKVKQESEEKVKQESEEKVKQKLHKTGEAKKSKINSEEKVKK